jgi:hypothetical protein
MRKNGENSQRSSPSIGELLSLNFLPVGAEIPSFPALPSWKCAVPVRDGGEIIYPDFDIMLTKIHTISTFFNIIFAIGWHNITSIELYGQHPYLSISVSPILYSFLG